MRNGEQMEGHAADTYTTPPLALAHSFSARGILIANVVGVQLAISKTLVMHTKSDGYWLAPAAVVGDQN